MKTVLTTLLAICVCLVIGCGQGPATKEVRDNPPEQTDLAGVEAKEFEKTKAEAEKGDAEAQFSLGVMYRDGQGVEQDFKEAVKWFQKAADQGHAKAQLHLGVMYYDGEGVEKDFKEAVKWYQKAAAQGDIFAPFNLGGMYAEGLGVEKDYVTAHAWWSIAAANGDSTAKLTKYNIAKKMTPEQIAKAQELSKEMIKENPKLLNKK